MIYQNLFEEIKSVLEADSALSSYLAADINYGNADQLLDRFPCMFIEPVGIEDVKSQFPRNRESIMNIQIRGKVKNATPYELCLAAFEFIEKVSNAIESNATFDQKMLSYDIVTEAMGTISDDVREIIMSLKINIQPFTEGSR